jgi:predicted nucleic acid-binding Zn ribbon protein
VVNQSLTPLDVTDPVLRSRRAHEQRHLREVADHAARTVLEPWVEGGARLRRRRRGKALSAQYRKASERGDRMPIYIYESIQQTPGEAPCYFEFEQHMTDEPFTTHPETGVPLRRVFHGGFSVGTGRQSSDGSGGGCCGPSSSCCG